MINLIEIENFGAIEKLNIKKSGLTVLMGDNNSGKSFFCITNSLFN